MPYMDHYIQTLKKKDLSTCKYISDTTDDGMPIKKLFVYNLAKRTTYKNLIKRFSIYGNVQSCFLLRNETKHNVAFITFDTIESAVRARDEVILLHNKYLKVKPADSWHQPDSLGYQYYSKEGLISDEKQSNEQCNKNLVENITKNSIQILNNDCLIHIFHQLPIVDRIRIERVCKRWRALVQESWSSFKKLNLLRMPNSLYYLVTDITVLRKILSRCGRFLNEINLSETRYQLPPRTLTIIAKLCPNLQKIDVTALTVSSAEINSLAYHCHDITMLSLKTATDCDRSLRNLFEVNLKLRYVKIVSCFMSGNCLLYLPAESMEEIVLVMCNCLQEEYLCQVFEKLQNLSSLTINSCFCFYFTALQAISTHCKKLKALNLYDAFAADVLINDDIIQSIQLPNLETFTIYSYKVFVNKFLCKVISNCQHLTYIDITACESVTGVELAAITTLPKLETLKMNFMDDMFDTSNINMRNMYSLKKLECIGVEFTDDTMIELLSSASQLELLNLTYCRLITNVTLLKAAAVTINRTNNILLKIFVGGTGVNLNDFKEVSPFLQIVNVLL